MVEGARITELRTAPSGRALDVTFEYEGETFEVRFWADPLVFSDGEDDRDRSREKAAVATAAAVEAMGGER